MASTNTIYEKKHFASDDKNALSLELSSTILQTCIIIKVKLFERKHLILQVFQFV